MDLTGQEKRKNDAPCRFQWWLLVIGFVLGVLATLLYIQVRTPTINTAEMAYTAEATYDDASLFLTATAVIEGATATVQAAQQTGTSTPQASP